jgi:hypothetical protein
MAVKLTEPMILSAVTKGRVQRLQLLLRCCHLAEENTNELRIISIISDKKDKSVEQKIDVVN